MSAEFKYCDGCSGYECDPIKGCAYPGISPRPTKPERGLTDDTKYFVGDDGLPLDLGAGDVLAIHDSLPETPLEAYALGWNECRAVFLSAQSAPPQAGEALPKDTRRFRSLSTVDDDVASPQPANPPQVTDALKSAEKALRPVYDAVFNDNGDMTVDGPHDYDEAVAGYFAYKKIERALAAIGAGGQAVAEPGQFADRVIAACRAYMNTYDVLADEVREHMQISMADALHASDALSQPHPADERVVEALPRLTESMMRAACKAHFGSENIDGVCVTVRDRDWTFRDAFKRMWSGARLALSAKEGR